MTMRIVITNPDENQNAVSVVLSDIGQAPDFTRHPGKPRVLKPGESDDFWIHQMREVLVSEMPEGWDAPLGDAPDEPKP
jgi:hypothetical protein